MSLATPPLQRMVIRIIEKDKLSIFKFCFQQFIISQSVASMHRKVMLQVFTFALLKFMLESFD